MQIMDQTLSIVEYVNLIHVTFIILYNLRLTNYIITESKTSIIFIASENRFFISLNDNVEFIP